MIEKNINLSSSKKKEEKKKKEKKEEKKTLKCYSRNSVSNGIANQMIHDPLLNDCAERKKLSNICICRALQRWTNFQTNMLCSLGLISVIMSILIRQAFDELTETRIQ